MFITASIGAGFTGMQLARALVLANATGKPQRVTGEWQGRPLDITLPPHDIRLVK